MREILFHVNEKFLKIFPEGSSSEEILVARYLSSTHQISLGFFNTTEGTEDDVIQAI